MKQLNPTAVMTEPPSSIRFQNTGAALWEKAKTIIPGGNQLLSKRAEMFLPGQWPAYYSRARGCRVWDLDGRAYHDFAQMGVGACVLGYAHPHVNRRVMEIVRHGSMCSLNPPEEVALAEKLIALHPWAEMARFGRTGGEACAIAVRIARAASGRSKVALCGYHGWHEWSLSANLQTGSNLDQHLLSGLDPKGVPAELAGTALPFRYNQLEELEALAKRHGREIGVIIMEPIRSVDPAPGFLEGVRKIADRLGAVLIFDEVSAGFRLNVGGAHLLHGVTPDMAVFGKALGNGYPIAAIIGKRSVMNAAQDSFISSTFWTERIGPAAALATIEFMEKNDVPDALVRYGRRIMEGWQHAAADAGLKIQVSGIPPLARLAFEHPDALALQTLYTQEMLDRSYLVGAAVYATYAYSNTIIDRFTADTTKVFRSIKQAVDAGTVRAQLRGPVKHAGFARLS